MTLLLGILRKAGFVVLVGLIALGLMIWFLGPRFGAQSVGVRLALIGLVAFFLLISYLMQRALAAQRGSQRLEKSLTGASSTAAVRPDKKQEIEQLKTRLAEAIAALKTSKLGKGKSGKTALYALPWYVIIGPPGSGKSTALLKSELNFPYMDAMGKGIRGVGGTRNCDFWFTSDAILLDTAGRYTTDTDDREEWLFFLEQLKKFRPQKPINGIIVAIAISDLMHANDEQLIEHARTVRARIDELIKRLGVTFPVYLLFTKCDLLEGFVETFEDLRKTERMQVWGTTIQLGDERPPRQIFDREFERLVKIIDDRRLTRLSFETKPETCEKLYLFPLELSSAQEPLAEFVAALFQPNPYQEQPLFRGFYFSSGTQEGAPLQLVMSKLMDTFRLPAAPKAPEQERDEAKSYFIHDLFAKIIFPDQGLAGPSLHGVRKEAKLRLWLALGASIFCLIWMIGGVVSFIGNQAMISRARDSFAAANQIDAARHDAVRNLTLLDSLRGQLDNIEKYGDSWRLGWGLNQSGELLETGYDLYFRKFNDLYFAASNTNLETKLKSPDLVPVRSAAEYYEWTRTYLLVTRPHSADSANLCNAFYQLVTGNAQEHQLSTLSALNAAQVDFFRRRLEHRTVVQKEDAAVLDSARKFLAQRLTSDSYYEVRLRAVNIGLPDRGLRELGISERKIVSDVKVPGVYTAEAWPAVTVAMGFNGPDKLNDWVLDQVFSGGELTGLKARLQGDLTNEYMRRMGNAWEELFESVSLSVASDPDEAAKDIKSITAENGLFALMDRATAATRPPMVDSALARPLRSRFRAVHDMIGTPKQGDAAAIPGKWAEYKDIIGDYSKAVRASAEGTVQVKQDLAKARKSADADVVALLDDYTPDQSQIIESLLLAPLGVSISASTTGGGGGGGGGGSGTWAKMQEKFKDKLSGKFPFAAGSSEEAAPKDLEDYFKDGDGTFWKLFKDDKDLAFCVTEQGESSGEDQCDAFLRYRPLVRTARTMTTALFSGGALKVEFKLQAETPREHKNKIRKAVLNVSGTEFVSDFSTSGYFPAEWSGRSGASLTLFGKDGGETVFYDFPGSFGLFRLLSEAERSVEEGYLRFTWKVEYPKGSGEFIFVPWRIQTRSSVHPFAPGFFEQFPDALR